MSLSFLKREELKTGKASQDEIVDLPEQSFIRAFWQIFAELSRLRWPKTRGHVIGRSWMRRENCSCSFRAQFYKDICFGVGRADRSEESVVEFSGIGLISSL